MLPQGQPERRSRVLAMVAQMDAEGFGTCTNHGECEAVCPKAIRMEFIARMNWDFVKAKLTAGRRKTGLSDAGAG
jgi:succinate dehydrogenase / fumarate reductase iron-sulfur subunit